MLRSWMNTCFSRCSFLIKIVPLGRNWCYLRLGRSRMGGEREVRPRWYLGRGDRKPLCNLVRLEIEAAIKPAGLNSACLLQLQSECAELLWTLDFTWVFACWNIFNCGYKESTALWFLKGYVVSLRNTSRSSTCEDRLVLCCVSVNKSPVRLCAVFGCCPRITRSYKIVIWPEGKQTGNIIHLILNNWSNRRRQHLLGRSDFVLSGSEDKITIGSEGHSEELNKSTWRVFLLHQHSNGYVGGCTWPTTEWEMLSKP